MNEADRAHKERMDAHHREVQDRNTRLADQQRVANQKHHDEQVRRIHGQSGGGCFAAGTGIMTASGLRRIESLAVGDEVSALCSASGQIVERQIDRYVAHSAERIWEISILDANHPIGTTGCHLFLTGRGWKRTRQLKAGDALRANTGWAKIRSVQMTTRIEPVYNLVVDGELTFIADGVVAHSFAYFRTLRTWVHRRKLRLRARQSTASAPALGHA